LYSCDKVILKPSHSKSSIGIREIFNSEDLSAAFSSDMSGFVLQKVELIERDCRIVVIRDEVVLQYWRSKPQTIGDEFVTTATSNGSRVVFNDYPEDIAHFAITSTHKLGLHSAAWDLIVVDDKIYALEVSPIYYPNASENYDNEIPYRNYKASFFYLLYMRREFSKHIRKRLGI
jgi:glutathione synthase/RimK-type ligase-like ATP-grasp enzyme